MTSSRLVSLTLLSALMTAVGCSSKQPPKEPDVVAEPTAPAVSEDPTTSPTDLPDSPTAAAVHIEDAILKACGIAAPQAFFAFDSAALQPGDAKPFEELAACFVSGPLKGRTLRLVGHADPRGEAEYNMVLGQSRADSVASFLQAKGLEASRISTSSRGAMDATGTDEPSWARDRRVDVLLGQ